MPRIVDRLHLNRTRVQILLGFLLVMTVVISTAGGMLYKSTTDLFIQNTEGYVGETAKQASARVDAVLSQVDVLTLQVVMDSRIQSLLLKSKQGLLIPIDQKLSVRPIIDQMAAFSWIIKGIDLYSMHEPLYPLENTPISAIIGDDPSTLSKLKAGQLVFVGTDPKDSEVLLAVRSVRLEQDHLATGGYLVIRVMKSLVDFFNEEYSSIKGSSMHLYDHNNLLVASTDPSLLENRNLNVVESTDTGTIYPIVRIRGSQYLHIIEQSRQFNWSIHILVPLSTIEEKSSVLKQILLIAMLVGLLVCLVLVWPLSRLITRPIAHLRAKMRKNVSLPEPNTVTYFNYEMNDLNTAYNKLVRELHHLIETVYEKERLKNQAEIKMLQAQIHPHFLFNTLESLYWTLRDKDENESAEIIIHLSKLFRYSIKQADSDDWTELVHEAEHCKRYLEIMKFRLGDRLSWDIEADPSVQRLKLPKLLIQPLVENAIQHGIEPKVQGGCIQIGLRAGQRGGHAVLHIQVKDNGEGMTDEEAARLTDRLSTVRSLRTTGSGIGLTNIQSRIKLYYGDEGELTWSSRRGQGTEINLYLPYKELDESERVDRGG
ncbi:sensor histidine kinase [Paenibacillus sp. TAB 01]|uniref:sensor histidine kinase n=1 Tax=Paenibacillus sp. TAB 01 TaxID=3368988 RepID=UPI0037503983